MNQSKKLFRLVFLLATVLLISAASCEDGLFSEEDKKKNSWEVHINDQQKMIRETVQGIEFKYCLLNEDTVPATTFEYGENFLFCFSVKNLREEDYYLPFMPIPSQHFAEVYQKDGTSLGRPFEPGPSITIGSAVHTLFSGKKYEVKFPWLYDFELWNELYKYNEQVNDWEYCWATFTPTNQPPLEKGKYYTKWSNAFTIEGWDDTPSFKTKKLTFKINFEIK